MVWDLVEVVGGVVYNGRGIFLEVYKVLSERVMDGRSKFNYISTFQLGASFATRGAILALHQNCARYVCIVLSYCTQKSLRLAGL